MCIPRRTHPERSGGNSRGSELTVGSRERRRPKRREPARRRVSRDPPARAGSRRSAAAPGSGGRLFAKRRRGSAGDYSSVVRTTLADAEACSAVQHLPARRARQVSDAQPSAPRGHPVGGNTPDQRRRRQRRLGPPRREAKRHPRGERVSHHHDQLLGATDRLSRWPQDLDLRTRSVTGQRARGHLTHPEAHDVGGPRRRPRHAVARPRSTPG